ncbi:MAG TPA: hypothetical protein PKA77_00385 [Chitinophagaceae bacterium]|jgi:hypothetical protein|nr:hypothetical protein [Chitinophagaceae bacterium]HMU59114.1 hypothetical protein [Chitinophagaceae bacterium]
MKTITLTSLLLLSLFQVKAQEVFGKATFTVPVGWQMTTATEAVTLEKPAKKGTVCKIFISATKRGSVTTPAEYQAYRTKNGSRGITYQNQASAITKYEAGGLTSFFSKGTGTQNILPVYSYFYSLSNGSQTLYYQLLTTSNECVGEFNQFMATLTMELEETANPENTQGRARKAAPAAPAAPAPMM